MIKVGNYYVGDYTNYYKKNMPLFDMAFRNEENRYGKWLEDSKSDIEPGPQHLLFLKMVE